VEKQIEDFNKYRLNVIPGVIPKEYIDDFYKTIIYLFKKDFSDIFD